MIVVKKKPKATKCSYHHTYARLVGGGLKRKLKVYLEKISLDLELEKELHMRLGC